MKAKKTDSGGFGQKKFQIADAVLFGMFLAGVFALTLWFFHRQAMGSEELYHSDMKAYIREMLGTEEKYSFPYPVFFKLGAFFNLFTRTPEFAIALAAAVLNALAIVIAKLALNRFCLGKLSQTGEGWNGLWKSVLVSFASTALFFVSMLYLRPMPRLRIKWNYLGVFTPTPWHNATYLAARPFMILAFLWAARLFDVYEEVRGKDGLRKYGRDYFLFALFLLLATMTKPSYTIVHLGAAGLVMAWRFFRAKGKNLVPTLLLGCCYLPTFLDLLYQYQGVFVPEDGAEGGIGFAWMEVWRQHSDNIPLAVLQAMAFPIVILCFHRRDLKENTRLRFSWQIYGMGFLMAALLYEKGFRIYDFNFAWGYMCGLFLTFLASAEVLLRDTFSVVPFFGAAKKADKWRGTSSAVPVWGICAEWLAFLAHLLCGLRYFATLMTGAIYY